MPMFYPLEVMRLRNDAGLRSEIGATFGKDVRSSKGRARPHQGWDLYAAVGTPAFAIGEGRIVWTQDAGKSGYGRQLLLEFTQHAQEGKSSPEDRRLYAFYAHLSRFVVAKGYVKAGDKIAETGISGNADARYPHLHFELRSSSSRAPGTGLKSRLDPGEVLGYHFYSCTSEAIGGVDTVQLISVSAGKPTPIRPR